MKSIAKVCTDKVVVVTGAGHGIGLEMVRLAAEHHGLVWALDIDQAALDRLANEAKQKGWNVFTEVADVTNSVSAELLVNRIIQKFKRIDLWINNAGIQTIGTFLGTKWQDFDRVMNVNLSSVVAITRIVLSQMERQGSGIILNMASTAGHVPSPFMAAYVASKHGVVGFSKALQAEMNMLKLPMRVAFASPGFVDTAIIEKGKEKGFPEWLSWTLVDSKTCAVQILSKLSQGQNEIHPTLSGKLIRTAYSLAPKTTVKSSKMLLAKGIKDFILNRYEVPR